MSASYAVDDFTADLAPRLRGEVRTDRYSRVLYSTDASLYQIMPLAVVMAASTDDVIATMEAAARYRLPVLPRGSGTSLAGQAVNEAVVIDLSRLDRILEVNAPERWVRVEPGLVLSRLNRALARHRLKFGPDPATEDRATLGGITGNNSTGSHSILYGLALDHVIGMEIVLADGTTAAFGPVEAEAIAGKAARNTLEGAIYRAIPAIIAEYGEDIRAHLPQTWRRCSGYALDHFLPEGAGNVAPLPPERWEDRRFNLARLMVGAEGTLGTAIGITLNLVSTPTRKALAVVHFDDLNAALESVPALLEVGPSAIELLDRTQMNLIRESTAWRPRLSFVRGDPAGVLLTEFYGESEAELAAKMDRLEAQIRACAIPAGEVIRLMDAASQAGVWAVRKAGLGLLMSMRGDTKPIPFIEDAAVPVAHLAAYVRDMQAICQEAGVPMAVYAHASAGCLHLRPILNLKGADGPAIMTRIARASAERVLHYSGTISSEHGDGRTRSWLSHHLYGDRVVEAFRQVKRAFDPENRLNPGIIVDAGPMTEHLRYPPGYQTLPLYEVLDWSADYGFAAAVEMCNGAGVCRKTEAQTMCPSFMVTREEEHSTRGRANLLRAALSGLLPREELFSPRMAGAMELCISCKACKSECPSAVDMARIKLEWQAHYYRHHAPDLRTRLFAHMPRFSAIGSRLSGLANFALSAWPVRVGLDAVLNIDRRRRLPTFQPAFTPPRPAVATGRKVVLYVDTWANYHETSIARAAFDVLTAGGYEVIIPPYACCGRTYLSKGFVNQARRAADRVMDVLAPYGRAGVPIVGLEPSCILTVRDEHQHLSQHPDRAAVAANTFTFEEFAARHTDEWADLFEPDVAPALLHGHCHQKSLVGTKPAHAALSLAHGQISEVDSGCCGMAGAFGYEAEHYDISRDMAYRRLVPAVLEAGPETQVIAAGMSCRHQIQDFTGRHALHPAEALARRLKARL